MLYLQTTDILYIQGKTVPSIEENRIKSLGKWFDKTLTDKNILSTEKQGSG